MDKNPNQLTIFQQWLRIWTQDYREQIQLAVRAGLELGVFKLQVQRSNCSAMILPGQSILITLWKVEPRSHFRSRLSLIIQVIIVLNRTVVFESDWRFNNLCNSHLQSQSKLYHISWWYHTVVIDQSGQLRRDVIGRLSVKPWSYWLWRLIIMKPLSEASC